MDMDRIKERLDRLREELYVLIDDIDYSNREQLLKVSQQLDEAIYEYKKTKDSIS